MARPADHSASATIRVLIADDHAVVREGIRRVLAAENTFEVVGEATNGSEAVELAQSLQPDVVVLDLSMPQLSGLEVAPRIRAAVPHARLLILSIHEHEEYVLQSVRAGAHGYLRKDSSPADLRRAIRTVHQGEPFFAPPVAQALAAALQSERGERDGQRGIAALTVRERDVLIQIARGAANKEIARKLGISVRTVESHREAIMKKLGLRGAASLTRFAVDMGLV